MVRSDGARDSGELRARRLRARPNKKILRGQRHSCRRRNPTLESLPSSYPGEFLAVFKPKVNAYLKFHRSTNKILYPPQITLPPEPDVVENIWMATFSALVQLSNTDILQNKCLIILFV